MSESRICGRACDAHIYERGTGASLGSADWLSLAATPAFAIMALLTAAHAGSAADILCSAAHDASPLSGMVLMYVLMAAFHSAPWLRWISKRREHRPTPL